MAAVGFEPTPSKWLVPKTSALDHSATLPSHDVRGKALGMLSLLTCIFFLSFFFGPFLCLFFAQIYLIAFKKYSGLSRPQFGDFSLSFLYILFKIIYHRPAPTRATAGHFASLSGPGGGACANFCKTRVRGIS